MLNHDDSAHFCASWPSVAKERVPQPIGFYGCLPAAQDPCGVCAVEPELCYTDFLPGILGMLTVFQYGNSHFTDC